ncbi:MAG: hypothetical protein GVY26_05605 [Bacteroidetes bacterium]|nr:hypothetical protein [Bacteroidota bacterium]
MSNSHMPPDFLQPCLFSVEEAVIKVSKEHPRLEDKDVEMVYDSLQKFFKKLAQGKSMDEPTSTITRKQALIEAIITALDVREELGADEHVLQNTDYTLGGKTIPYLETLYATGFNYLRRSARFWRKENGARGYLSFIRDNVPN